jgi:hypothetical protein
MTTPISSPISPIELRILVFTDRNGRATIRLVGDGVPHHRVPALDARRELIGWLDEAQRHVRRVRPARHHTLDDLVSLRARRLTERFGDFASPHEIYGVLAEELDEFFAIVKQRESVRSTTKMIRELVDIASAALRAANQLAASLDHKPTDAEVLNA